MSKNERRVVHVDDIIRIPPAKRLTCPCGLSILYITPPEPPPKGIRCKKCGKAVARPMDPIDHGVTADNPDENRP